MARHMNAKTLQDFLKKKKAKETASPSKLKNDYPLSPMKTPVAESSTTFTVPGGLQKKRNRDAVTINEEKEVQSRQRKSPTANVETINLSTGDPIDIESAKHWTSFFTDFHSNNAKKDPTASLWDSRFPFDSFIDSNLCLAQDISSFQKADPLAAGDAMTAWSLRLAFLSHNFNNAFRRLQEDNQKKDADLKKLEESCKKFVDLEESLKSALTKNEDLNAANCCLTTQVQKLTEDRNKYKQSLEVEVENHNLSKDNLEKCIIELNEKIAKLETDKDDIGGEAAFQYANGFELCRSQIQFLLPNCEVLNDLGMFKIVKDGALVQNPEVEEDIQDQVGQNDEAAAN